MTEDYYYKGPEPNFEHHTEQKIVEHLRKKYYGNQEVSGQIEIISERVYCKDCRGLVDLFEKEFPNIKVICVWKLISEGRDKHGMC